MALRYSGYLAPHLDLIHAMANNGAKNTEIARHLYEIGVRSYNSQFEPRRFEVMCLSRIAAMVSVLLRSQRKKTGPRVTRLVQDWQTWTPEMQEAEFASGYAR